MHHARDVIGAALAEQIDVECTLRADEVVQRDFAVGIACEVGGK